MSAVERYVDDSTITGLTRYAKAYSGSGYFKDAASVEKAFVVISAGAEIGIAPFAAITGIALIQGKPVIGAGILAGLVKSHPNYDYRVRRLDDEGCTIAFFQNGEEIGESSFTIADAKRAKLDGKDVWKNYPRNMLFARAISNGVAFYTPDVTTTRVYVEGELDDVPATPPRPIASARPQMVSTETDPPAGEVVVDAELEESAPEPPRPAEAGASTPTEQAGSSSDPVTALAAVLNAMKPEHRKAVRARSTLIGIKWSKETPAALVAHFGDHHDALMAHLAEPEVQAEVEPEGSEPTADTAEEFQEWVDQQIKDDAASRAQMAKAGNYGK